MITFDTVIGLLAPHTCIACGAIGSVLCDTCILSAGDPITPRCAGCKQLSEGWKTCVSCRRWLSAKTVIVATHYDSIYKELIHAYKFVMQRDAASALADMISAHIDSQSFGGFTIVPIPTAPSRVRMRGFNNGALLAKKVAQKTNLPYATVLRRQSNTRQVGASRSKRIRQMEREFFVTDKAKVANTSFLLIDDVMTTGATIAAAAKTLKEAGAKQVSAAVFAQKI